MSSHRATAASILVAALVLVPAAAARAALHLPHLPHLPGFGGPPTVEVAVREVPAEDLWQVRYHLPVKAAGVDLVYGRGSYRRRGWSVVPAGSQWVDAPDVERLCFPARGRDFAISFRTDVATRPKDYEVNVAMSDGGRLLYTGHLAVRPLAHCGAGADAQPAGEAPVHRFRFTTVAGRTVRVGDRAGDAALPWEATPGNEQTYAYFGPQPGVVGERMALVADPTLPSWVRGDLEATVAKLFDRFAGETGLSLPARPLVLLAFDPRGHGRSFDGGVLGEGAAAVVTLSARGAGWLAGDAGARREWTVRLAHELFHLWDGGALHADGESEWLAEAAAETFALRGAQGLGVVGEGDLAATVIDLGNRCLASLGGESLLAAPARGGWDSWYTCGPVLLFVADHAVEAAHPGEGGVGLLVRRMFEEGRQAGNVYGTGVFLGWLDKLAGNRELVFALQRMIRRGVATGADRFLLQLLQGAGYRVVLAPPEESQASLEVFRTLLHSGLVRCGAPERVVRVGDVEARTDPAAAYAQLRAAARRGQPLRVVADDDPQPITLLCGREAIDASFEQLLKAE